MPLPKLGTFFECNWGMVWVVSRITPTTDVAEAKVLLVRMMGHEQEMGTMANEVAAGEWDKYCVEHRLTPCGAPPPMLRSAMD
jgi:hypothetical protein